jgi:predicted MFS family arabinose efflux permease
MGRRKPIAADGRTPAGRHGLARPSAAGAAAEGHGVADAGGGPPQRGARGGVAQDRRFAATARLIFAIALASFVLSFVHRTAPAAIAGELTQAFSISAAVLGTLAATYFYVYTLLQIPVGVAADTVGPRRILTAGSAVAAVGSLLFALAPVWEIAALGRTLVGIGVSVAFIAILKVSAVWFPPARFATLAGVTMFAGNLGAVAAGAPLAWLVTLTSWRVVFVALAALSGLLALATWLRVRDSPQELGFASGASAPAAAARVPWLQALARVLANRSTWPAFVVNAGVGGSFLAFAGLWGVPYLQQVYGMPRVAAAQHTSLLLLGVAFGSLAIGMISDRLGSRAGVMRAFVLAYTLSWLPWLLQVAWPLWATLSWFFVMGLLIPGFTLSWTIAKEANPPQYSGIATSVVNLGIFLGTGILQPWVGWILDQGRAAGDLAGAWERGIGLLAAAAAVGAVMAFLVTGKRRG